MAQFSSNTKIRGDLNVESEITQSDLKYNVSKITNNEEQIIGDDKIDTSLNARNINLKANGTGDDGIINLSSKKIVIDIIKDSNNQNTLNGILIGTSLPSSNNAVEGQIYFKIIT